MSAKLLYNLSEENPNLNKELGCMNRLLHVFYRQHYPARPVSISGNVVKSLPSGDQRDIVNENNMESDKVKQERSIKKKEKHRVSYESSSRLSYSSSPRSSSFSSTEVSTTTSHNDHPKGRMMMPCDIKELVKGSISKEMRSRGEETTFTKQKQQPNSARTSFLLPKESSPCRSSIEWNEGRGMALKFKEGHRLSYDEREMRNNGSKSQETTPRLSLDSRSNSFRSSLEEPATTSHRRSNSSVVAKLMGLDEVIEDNGSETEERRENRFCDSPRPISRVEPTSLPRSRSVDSIKNIPASKFPMEPAPWKQRKAGDDGVPTVYGEIHKRLTQLEFKKSGKDLRALKQILEAMEKTQQSNDGSRDITRKPVSTVMNFKSSTIVVAKPKDSVPISLLPKNVSLPNVKVGNGKSQTRKVTSGKQNAMDLTPRPGLHMNTKTLRSTQAFVVESCSMTIKSGRSQQLSVSPRTHPKRLGFERLSRPTTPKAEPSKIQRQHGKQQTDSASPRRKQEMKPHSTTLQHLDDRLSDASSDLRSLKVTVEHSSPVSVLDTVFYEEDSPSPVRKITLTFKEDDAQRSEESEFINKPTGFCRSISLPDNNQNPTLPDSEVPECFKRRDDKYISEILLASGLLRDFEYSMVTIQLHQARLPINPGLFLILEQNKSINKHRGLRQQQTNTTDKLRRKLIFDTVNELLAQKFAAEGCVSPRLTANSLNTIDKISKEEQLLHILCSEIDRLQQNNSKCILEDNEEDIIWEELQSQDMNTKGFEGETPGIVLDIERMIFRDLINEVCFC